MSNGKERQKVNFMLDKHIIVQINELVPAGKRSDFVNEALQDRLTGFARRKAFEDMRKMAKKTGFRMTTDEILKLKNYGRE